jgi:hypothetical protein
MTDAIAIFVIAQNIAHYEKLLQRETREDKRDLLFRLLANEREKLPGPAERAPTTGAPLATGSPLSSMIA